MFSIHPYLYINRPVAAPTVTAPTQATPTAPSKAMASATVRLFKINPTNNAYEPCAGGSPLGCVIIYNFKYLYIILRFVFV